MRYILPIGDKHPPLSPILEGLPCPDLHLKSMILQMDKTVLARGLAILLLLYSIRPVEGIIGYDCTGATLNITTVSLLEIGECDIPAQEVNETAVHIQLLQVNQYSSIQVRQCKIEIYRVIRRCGMWTSVPNSIKQGELKSDKQKYLEPATTAQ